METNTNVLASTRDQCFAIAFQNQVKILSNKLKYFTDVVNPLLIYLPPLNHIVKTPSLQFKHPPLPFPLICHNQINK